MTDDHVIADLAEIKPFTNIRDAKARHSGVLKYPYTGCGVPIPKNKWSVQASHFKTQLAACKYSVVAARERAVMYERIKLNTDNQNFSTTFDHLAEASQKRYRQAF